MGKSVQAKFPGDGEVRGQPTTMAYTEESSFGAGF